MLKTTPEQSPTRERDGLRLALMTSRFDGVVRAMTNTLSRTARSTLLNTAKDFSVCLLTNDGRVISMVESLAIHVLSGGELQIKALRELHPDMKPGDAFLNNSPYHGNSHAADWTLLVPIFDRDGEHRFTAFVKAHLADCGNALPTTYMVGARDVYGEGALIFPCVKVQSDYRDHEDIIRMAMLRIRVPEMWHGDYQALVGAARIGERRVLELLDEYGVDEIDAFLEDWFDYSEQRMADAVRCLPSGVLHSQARHDPIPGIIDDGIEITATTTIDSDNATITVDLRDNPDSLPCGLNLTESTAKTAAMVGVFAGLGCDVPINDGSLRRVHVKLRENCCVGIPRHPASCSVSTSNLTEVIAHCVSQSFAELGESYGIAGFGKVQPASWSVISGADPRRGGAPFVNQVYLAATGGAGGPHADGWLTAMSITAAGGLLLDSVEIDEMKYPLRIYQQRLIPDSEGAGRRRGSPGALVEYGPIGTTITAAYLSDGTYSPPLGVRGGGDGSTAQQRRKAVDGSVSDEIGVAGLVDLADGESLISVTCGGGGYGPPTAREPERVLHDVTEGIITLRRAESVYGVVVTEAGEVVADATARRRAELQAAAAVGIEATPNGSRIPRENRASSSIDRRAVGRLGG